VGSLGGFARASDVLFRAHVSGVNPKTARFQIWRNTVIQIWQIFSDEDVVRPARARRGVHALSALQHVFLVVVALVLLGASTVRAYGYEPTCAASYENSTDVVKADVLPGTPGIHAFTANNVLYARLDITYNATGTDTVHLFLWGASGVNSSSVCGAWQGGITSTHELFMGVACNAGGSGGISANPYLDAGGRYVLEYYYDSQSSNARMYKTCMGLCGANETLGVTIELTPAGGVAVNMFMSDGQISVGHEDHSVNPPSPDSDFTGTFHSAAFYDCPPPPPCDINEHVASNVCTACIGGSTNPAGDDPYGANTTCGCSTNTSVVYNVCTACVGGSTNPAGDDPGGANTTCGCSTNTSVVSNVCTPCGHGGSTDAGDAVPGPDTQCIYPTCDINEHVASNVCTACVGGSTIRAGRTLLAAARQIRPSFRTYAPRAATGVPPMQSMRFQVQTPRVFILPVSKLSEYTSWRTTWRTTRTGRGTTDLKRYRSPRRAWKTAVFALATRLASRQPW
jgi:hypothetical protein